jgi:Tol biopolymer transport system component
MQRFSVVCALSLALAACATADAPVESLQDLTPIVEFPAGNQDLGQILFSSFRTGEARVYQVSSDGSELQPFGILSKPATFVEPSPDGNLLAAVFRMDENNYDVVIVDATGTSLFMVTRSRDVIDNEPAWSPDGTKIAFASNEARMQDIRAGFDIYVSSLDGSKPARLTDSLTWGVANVFPGVDPPQWNTSPDWSPDGENVVFRTTRDGNNEIYVMGMDGSAQRNLTKNPASDTDPAWSPDGSLIAFVSDRDGNEEIYVMNTDGYEPRRLTRNLGKDTYPVWSPDGQFLAFYSELEGEKNLDIFVMRIDGSDRIRLTTHPEFDGYPAWVPSP